MRDTVNEVIRLHNSAVLTKTSSGSKSVMESSVKTAPRLEKEVKGRKAAIADQAVRKKTPHVAAQGHQSHRDTQVKNVDSLVELSDVVNEAEENGGWTSAKTKRKKRKPREKVEIQLPRSKPDAIVILQNEGRSYADILKRVKSDPGCEGLKDFVQRIRRTQKGDLLLELKNSGEKTDELRSAVNISLGDNSMSRSLEQKAAVEIVHIDAVTTKEEICDAIKYRFERVDLQVSEIVSLRKAYAGMQTATIITFVRNANRLLQAARLK